ncbi:caspase family protein [Streptomyces sp. NPDC001848]|uniref:caspase, EACC1-associated type n=1 Tax=Streptomyces sp. NPDC001848 TaxID=3364618 RepID=UPI00369A6492
MLVGVSRYHKMPEDRQLPAVENNLRRLADLLREPLIWGLPPEHCVVLHQPDDADAVISALQTAAKEATASLVFYYAGHGLIDPLTGGDELYLALPRSREPAGTHLALRYEHVRAELLRAAAVPQKVVILDCCWSGRALKGTMGTDDLAAVAAVNGTAVLAACAATAKALSPAGEDCTAFTGALTQILREGLPGGPRELDIRTLFQSLNHRLGSENRPRPQLATSGSGSDLVLARNRGWQEHTETPVIRTQPAPAVVRPPALCGEHVRPRIRELLRAGRYEEAQDLRLRLAEAGDMEAVREVVTQLQREGHYQPAARLEAAPTSEAAQEVLRWLRQGHHRMS